MDLAWPTDPAPLVALLLAAIVAWPPAARWLLGGVSARAFTIGCAIASALLSLAYVALYLRGGPRIIDATTYHLEARALSEGLFAWPVGEVPASTMGRFLVRDALGTGEHAAGIFPPGYPAALALGFLVGAPMLVGPSIAAALSLALVDLARSLARASGAADAETPARVAGLLGVVCAALRYHTADTMSHGLAALCFTAALGAAYRARAGGRLGAPIALGLAAGWLVATRPPSALALALVVALALGPMIRGQRRALLRTIGLAALGALPGVALLVAHQRAATGALGASSQALYYALSDGPSGCFRYGFGEGIGCRLEHGDFVAHNLPDGYGLWPAIKTTARRLDMHLVDALGARWLGPLALGAVAWGLRGRALRPASLALPALALAYAPFYFDGNYPGGGARFYADGLAVELVVIALGWHALAPGLQKRARWLARPLSIVALSLLGFAVSGQVDHARLRDREGGRPLFSPADLERAGVRAGLVFVDTDHGFGLGFDPGARASASTLEVVRYRGDAHDRLLWELRGRPPTHRHVVDVSRGAVSVVPFVPEPATKLEAEALWPPVAQEGAYAEPTWPDGACVSGRRALTIRPSGAVGGAPRVRLALPTALAGRSIAPRVIAPDGGFELRLWVDGATRAAWRADAAIGERAEAGGCRTLPAAQVPPGARIELELALDEPIARRPGAAPAAAPSLDAILLVSSTDPAEAPVVAPRHGAPR